MIHTYPEAEAPISKILGPTGKRAWHWAEFGLHIPYYLLEVAVPSENEIVVRHIITADTAMVILTHREKSENFRLRSASLLSPGYLTGSDSYQFNRLAAIWSSGVNDYTDILFVFDDTGTLRFSLHDTPAGTEPMHLAADFGRLGG